MVNVIFIFKQRATCSRAETTEQLRPAAVAGYLPSAPLAPAVKAVMKAELES